MKPQKTLLLTLGLAAATQANLTFAQQADVKPNNVKPNNVKPNIVFILADDLGYGDLSCYGQKNFQTPNIDKLASEGMRFTSAYAGSTVCAPSRSALMTGYHMGRAHIRGNGAENDPRCLRDQDVTIAELLKPQGYTTGIIGKWGLGLQNTQGQANRQGFDEFFGYAGHKDAHNLWPPFLWRQSDKEPLRNEGDFAPGGAGKATKKVDYAPTLIANEAIDFVKRHREKPFFLYWSINMPHANNEANDLDIPDYSKFANRDWPEQQKKLAATIELMDGDVGRLMQTLKEQGLDERTLVIFTSDNGPHREGRNNPDFQQSSGPLRGIKRDLYEGGIRVPFIARWTKQIAANTQSDLPIAFWDFMPTACELADSTVPEELKIDGISFLPTLLGKGEQKKHASLYWEFYENGFSQAARVDKWKAIKPNKQKPIELYDLSVDISEKNNLAAQHPDILARFETVMRESHVPSPFWPNIPAKSTPQITKE